MRLTETACYFSFKIYPTDFDCPAAPYLAWRASDPRARRVLVFPRSGNAGAALLIQYALTQHVTIDLLYDAGVHPSGLALICDTAVPANKGEIIYGAQDTSQMPEREAIAHLLSLGPGNPMTAESIAGMFEFLNGNRP